jgi:hypothetical protein
MYDLAVELAVGAVGVGVRNAGAMRYPILILAMVG